MINHNRREFIKTTSATAAGVVLSPALLNAQQNFSAKPGLVCAFTKCLQFIAIEKLGDFLASMNYKGADLTVRKGGHVSAENIATDLPKAIKSLERSGIKVPLIVTDVIDPDDPETDKILGVAAANGVKYYRMGYLNYDAQKSIPQNLDNHKKTIEKLEKINRKHNIHGGYQNHSGIRVGGPVWDLYWLVKDCDPAYIGVQYDIRHAVCEGGGSWPIGMKLLAPWSRTVDIKDFFWKKVDGKWKINSVPLGEGMIDFDAYLKLYKELELSGPVSLHFEYDLGGAESGKADPKMGINEIAGFLERDLSFLQVKFKEFGME